MKNDLIYMIALILVIIGGINWGLVGLLNLNLVALLFGATTIFTRLLYIVIAAAAGYIAYNMYLETVK